MESGLVIHSKSHYLLRVDNLKALVEEVEKDIQRTTADLKKIAEDIDKWIGL